MTMNGDPKKASPMFVKDELGRIFLNTEVGWQIEVAPDLISDDLRELLDYEILPEER